MWSLIWLGFLIGLLVFVGVASCGFTRTPRDRARDSKRRDAR